MRPVMIFLAASLFSISAFAEPFTLTTNAFLDSGILPVLYTCDSKDVSPQFSWSNPPAKTQSFALVVSDPDAPNGTFYHWILYNIPSQVKELEEGVTKLPSGATIAKNSFGKMSYNGPCPPKGAAHTYKFDLYALDTKLKDVDEKNIDAAMKDHVLGVAKMTAVYSRWAT